MDKVSVKEILNNLGFSTSEENVSFLIKALNNAIPKGVSRDKTSDILVEAIVKLPPPDVERIFGGYADLTKLSKPIALNKLESSAVDELYKAMLGNTGKPGTSGRVFLASGADGGEGDSEEEEEFDEFTSGNRDSAKITFAEARVKFTDPDDAYIVDLKVNPDEILSMVVKTVPSHALATLEVLLLKRPNEKAKQWASRATPVFYCLIIIMVSPTINRKAAIAALKKIAKRIPTVLCDPVTALPNFGLIVACGHFMHIKAHRIFASPGLAPLKATLQASLGKESILEWDPPAEQSKATEDDQKKWDAMRQTKARLAADTAMSSLNFESMYPSISSLLLAKAGESSGMDDALLNLGIIDVNTQQPERDRKK